MMESEKDGRQGEWTDTPRGPSWMDAFALAAAIEAEFGLRIHFRVLTTARAGRWAGRSCSVLAVACRVREQPQDSIAGSAVFGGVNGRATLPGAIVDALYDLDEKVRDPGAYWAPPRYETA